MSRHACRPARFDGIIGELNIIFPGLLNDGTERKKNRDPFRLFEKSTGNWIPNRTICIAGSILCERVQMATARCGWHKKWYVLWVTQSVMCLHVQMCTRPFWGFFISFSGVRLGWVCLLWGLLVISHITSHRQRSCLSSWYVKIGRASCRERV